MLFFWSFFGRFGVPTWGVFGAQNRPKMGQVGLKMALETIFFEKSDVSRKAVKTNIKSIKMTPRAVTKQPKIVHKRCQDDLAEVFFSVRFLHWFLIDFWSDFGPLWDPFWWPFGGPNRSFLASIFTWFLHVVLWGSKRAPRGSKRRPRAPQEAPRRPQETPRAGQEGSKLSKIAPRGSQ